MGTFVAFEPQVLPLAVWLFYHNRRCCLVVAFFSSSAEAWFLGGCLDRRKPQNPRQKTPCEGFSALCDVFRSPPRNNSATATTTLGTQVDHVVGGLNHVQVVLDDHNRVALVDKFVQHVEQLVGVLEVQAGRRFVEDVECAPCAPA